MVAIISHLPPTDSGLAQATDSWLTNLATNYNTAERQQLATACTIARLSLSQQQVPTGETQARYNLATADILAQLRLDVETLQVALLQGIGDTHAVNPEVARLTQGLNRPVVQMIASMANLNMLGELPTLNEGSNKERQAQAEGLRRLLLGMVDDVRAILVLLAGRLHLLRIAKNLGADIRYNLAVETQRLYAPLANRLGIWQIKWELEDLSLRFLEPDEYKRIAALLDECRSDRERYIGQLLATLKTKLNEVGIHGQVSGRPKHIYSIWRKMSRKKVSFNEIFDVRAVRILVDTVADCYAALGIVHGLWHHIPKEFDDYIATPKANLYQSIHTAVVGPEDKPVEIQIRTHDMHKHAELGVAAHWRYKENTGQDVELERLILRMRHWLEKKTEGNCEEGVEELKSGFEAKHIYVLTPHNRVITLPKGATALDFAYAIHSEVGHACRGARVGGRLIQLTQPLQSGQTVEIITTKNGAPSRDWLNPHLGYLHTNSARNRVRHWFKQRDFMQHITLGRALLDKELAHADIDKAHSLDSLAQHFNYKGADDLLAAIGRGDLSPIQVLNQIKPRATAIEPPSLPHLAPQHLAHRETHGHSTVVVDGVANLMTQMAGCCKPVPYDSLVGFITQGRGVTVHRDNCPNMLRLPESQLARLIQVHWGKQPITESYAVDLLVVASDRKGLLRDLSAVISAEDVDVLGVNSASHRSTDIATFRFTVEITHTKQLDSILSHLTTLPEVIAARRFI